MSQQQNAAKNDHPDGEIKKQNWHWLSNKHPVEFSNNKHTPQPTPQQGAADGATSLIYLLGPGLSSLLR
jgi:hypothetical protein